MTDEYKSWGVTVGAKRDSLYGTHTIVKGSQGLTFRFALLKAAKVVNGGSCT